MWFNSLSFIEWDCILFLYASLSIDFKRRMITLFSFEKYYLVIDENIFFKNDFSLAQLKALQAKQVYFVALLFNN